VGNNFIEKSAKCENTKDAWRVFNSLPIHDAISWIAMHAHAIKALRHFDQMCEGVEPNTLVIVPLKPLVKLRFGFGIMP
jgi:hypothetical protein